MGALCTVSGGSLSQHANTFRRWHWACGLASLLSHRIVTHQARARALPPTDTSPHAHSPVRSHRTPSQPVRVFVCVSVSSGQTRSTLVYVAQARITHVRMTTVYACIHCATRAACIYNILYTLLPLSHVSATIKISTAQCARNVAQNTMRPDILW